MPVARQEYVLGLEVAMDDALGVRGGKAVGNRRADIDRLAPGQRAGRDAARAEFRPSSSSITANGTPSATASS